MKTSIILSLIIFSLPLYQASFAGDKLVAAYFLENEVGQEIAAISNGIIHDRIKSEPGLTWMAPDNLTSPADNSGLFLKPEKTLFPKIIYNEIRNQQYRYLVEYKIMKLELRAKKNISIPYIMNRFGGYLEVVIEYKVINPESEATEMNGSFSYEIDAESHVQFFEYDPWRADVLLDAVTDDMIINYAAEKAAAIIINQMRLLEDGGLLALK